ncbi:hypothetical protein BDQ17DRAFT_1199666, partial [Cyathus striatus]
ISWVTRIFLFMEWSTGLWVVEPHFDALQCQLTSVIHIDTILHSAHLIPVYGPKFIPSNFA